MRVEPFLFSSNPDLVGSVAGRDVDPMRRVGAVVVDWERSEKAERQVEAEAIIGIDTQIASEVPGDLVGIIELATTPVLCRIDAWEYQGRRDLEAAIEAGVSEVIIPMVRSPEEVKEALEVAAGRVGVGVMIETVDAVAAISEIASLPIARAYLGLMDLAIERRTPSIFLPLWDGTLERAAAACEGTPFGFGGLTVPGSGSPIPTILLAAEMVRLGCSFTFLRRSFLRDAGEDPAAGVRSIRRMIEKLAHRSPEEVAGDRRRLTLFLKDHLHV